MSGLDKPEYVLNPEQWAAMKTMADRGMGHGTASTTVTIEAIINGAQGPDAILAALEIGACVDDGASRAQQEHKEAVMSPRLEDHISTADLAVLFGVPEIAVNLHIAKQPDGELGDVPTAWAERGHRRCNEYQAHTGDDDIFRALAWLRANPQAGE